MAESTVEMAVTAWFQVGIGIIALILLGFTVCYTRKAAVHARGANEAAKAAVLQTQRQVDAAIMLDAARVLPSEANLLPPGGGMFQSEGVPENGLNVRVLLYNAGKTLAFLEQHAAILRVSASVPDIRFPFAAWQDFEPRTEVDPGKHHLITRAGRIDIDERDARAIATHERHLWLLGRVQYRDWFGIRRHVTYIFRWKPSHTPDNETQRGKLGFILHSHVSGHDAEDKDTEPARPWWQFWKGCAA